MKRLRDYLHHVCTAPWYDERSIKFWAGLIGGTLSLCIVAGFVLVVVIEVRKH
jgi:hypothetical protein